MSGVIVSLCCNDERGNRREKVSAIHIGTFDLVCTCDPPAEHVCYLVRHPKGPETLHLGHRSFPVISYREYYGNLMWDGAAVSLEVAAEILNMVRTWKWWQPEGGPTSLWRRWESGEPFVPQDLIAEVGR